MAAENYEARRSEHPHAQNRIKLGFMDVSSATNARTMIASLIPESPCGNKVPVLASRHGSNGEHLPWLCSILNSVVYDFQLRCRLGGLTLNWFIVEETAIPKPLLHRASVPFKFARHVLALAASGIQFAHLWHGYQRFAPAQTWKSLWAIGPVERLRMRCILDALVAEAYGITCDDLLWILHNCDYPALFLGDRAFYRTLDPKGFWRVEKEIEPELRHTILTLAAFHDLKETIRVYGDDRDKGIEAFCAQNNGEGWMLPENLCLADLVLGHDERAKKPQPVRVCLGNRFFSWQLEQSAEDSWKECELHARNLLGPEAFSRLKSQLHKEKRYDEAQETLPLVAETGGEASSAAPAQRRLFPGKEIE